MFSLASLSGLTQMTPVVLFLVLLSLALLSFYLFCYNPPIIPIYPNPLLFFSLFLSLEINQIKKKTRIVNPGD